MNVSIKREACPYCGEDALSGPNAHLKREGCINALRSMHLKYQQRISQFILDHLEELKNENNGVIGYTLNLNADETEMFIRELDNNAATHASADATEPALTPSAAPRADSPP